MVLLLLALGCSPVPAVVQALNGPTTAASEERSHPMPATDGSWRVTPDEVRIDVLQVGFEKGRSPRGWIDVVDCAITYDLSLPTLDPVFDCPFAVPPGTYTGMRLKFAPELMVTVDDPVSGLYSDGIGLSATAPAGGPVPSPIPGQDTVRTVFAEPLEVGTEPVQISLVVNAIHAIGVTVTGGQPEVPRNRVDLFATPNGVGEAQFLGSGDTVLSTDAFADTELLLFYEDPTTPSYAFLLPGEDLSPCGGGDFYQAYATSPGIPDENGQNAGGYLALDPDDTICFALPQDGTWSQVHAAFRLAHVTDRGGATTLECQPWADSFAPEDGASTWAAGCPVISAQGSSDLTLLAD